MKSPHSILFLDHATALGGAENSLLMLLERLDRTLWSPHLACSPGALADRAAKLGIVTHAASFPRLRRSPGCLVDWLRGALALAQASRRMRARAMVSNTVRATLYGALAARLSGIPFIWYMRDFWLSEARPRFAWADRMGKLALCASARSVIANSHATAASLPHNPKVTVIHNGLEPARFDPQSDGAAFRQKHQIPPDAPLVGMVGRLRPWKGQESFLRMAAIVGREAPEIHFVLVGGDPFQVGDDYAQRIQQLVEPLSIKAQLHFSGHLEDVRPALAAMQVFVHPGSPEPFGLVNLEAMGMAKPIVAYAHGALPEIVLPDETGLLVPPGDETALAQAVSGLLHNPEKRARLGSAGRRRLETSFSIEQTAQQFEARLQQTIRP